MKLAETIVAAVLGLAAVVNGHMEMISPLPFRSKFNTAITADDRDYSMTSPLDKNGTDFPCKGYHNLLGTPLGASAATWAPGGSYSFTITGNADHNGGSCQASLSYDKGQTFKVIHSYIGGCPPAKGDSSYQFTVPTDAPAGEALFAWTWFNRVGNREMYMNCAAVTIGAGKKRDASTPFSSRPDIFVANVANGVCTYEGKDVQLPNPGPDVDYKSLGTVQPGPPPGQEKCGQAVDAPAAPPAAPPAGQPIASPAPAPVVAPVVAPPQATQPAETYPSASKIPGGVFITSPVGQPAGQPTAKPTAPVNLTSKPPAVTSSQPKPSSPPAVATSAAASVPAAPQQTKPASGGSSPSNGAVTAGAACSGEGQWSCASDGKSFQRCASGMWSASMPVAPGTSCQPGTSDSLTLVNKRSGSDFVRRRRFVPERFQRERALA
nr:hypothetical protein [Trichoderma harzianum]